MGSFLDKPVTEKETEEQAGELRGGSKLQFGVSAMQGWRVTMEDAHIHSIGLEGHPELGVFGVFDGHGGAMVAMHSARALEDEIRATPGFDELSSSSKGCEGKEPAALLGSVTRAAFLSLDAKMRELPAVKTGEDHSGSTAVMSFITPSHYVIANCGDSRLVVCGGDGGTAAVLFSTLDHKPTLASEAARIEKAGGTVSFRRVNGDLAVSRSLGDFLYKCSDSLPDVEQQVSPEPDMSIVTRNDSDKFMVVACDGIWDVMSNEEVCAWVLDKMQQGFPLGVICEDLIDHCLGIGSRDNMSVILVALPGAPDSIGTMSDEDIKNSRPPAHSVSTSSTDSSFAG